MKALAVITVFESNIPLAKEYSKKAGKVAKSTAAQMYSGVFSTLRCGSACELAEVLASTNVYQALCASVALDGSESGRIVTARELPSNPGAKARTKAAFGFPAGPGLFFIDCDEASISPEALKNMLSAAAPGLLESPVVWRPSGSSFIFDGAIEVNGLRGQHVMVLVADASDVPRATKAMKVRMWLAGHGSIKVSAAGSLLERCPIDMAVNDCARLIFSGGAACRDGLEQRRGPPVIWGDGPLYDTRRIAEVTSDELQRYETLVAQAKAAAAPEVAAKKAEHRASTVAARLPVMMAQGVSAAEAETRIGEALDAALSGTLTSDFVLTVVHPDGKHEAVTVGAMLGDVDKWDGADCLDPINPTHRGGSADARVFLRGASPIIYSLDDGGRVYRLRSQRAKLVSARGARHEMVSKLADLISGQSDVFMTDSGPVLLQRGRVLPLTVDRLMNVAGSLCAIFAAGDKGKESPLDLSRDVAVLVLAALSMLPSACQ